MAVSRQSEVNSGKGWGKSGSFPGQDFPFFIMLLEIRRQQFSANATLGELWVDGNILCFTLEPAQSSGILVQLGSYPARLELSPRLSEIFHRPFITPRLYGVPGYPNDDVLIHPGNYPSQTEGCCLVGLVQGPDYLEQSDAAFANLMALLPAAFTVAYLNPELA
jgi:hypothetical protein